ncbi:MAG: trehalose-phosphatase [Acidimicrobiales bacterium]
MTSDSLSLLGEELRRLAAVPVLLVATDYDGTLAPLVDDPDLAVANPESVSALRALGRADDTFAALISGRSLDDLRSVSSMDDAIRLVGSHGSEFDVGFASDLDPESSDLRSQLIAAAHQVASEIGGRVEQKPAGLAFHLRGASRQTADAATTALREGPGSWEGVFWRHGHDVVELTVTATNKGDALERIRGDVGATAVLFLGDDTTDEDAFATLRGPDVGIHVGQAETAAGYRVDSPDTVSRILALLSELRSDWLTGSGLQPIEAHSLLSDQRTAAIVDPNGRIVWMCVPRVDSGAVFAELLGGASAGSFDIVPIGGSQVVSQSYRSGSMILETRFEDFTVTDYMDVSGNRTSEFAGRSDLIRVLEGTGEVHLRFAPRLDFGRIPTALETTGGGVRIRGAVDPFVLRCSGSGWEGCEWSVTDNGQHQTAHTNVDLMKGRVILELRTGTDSMEAHPRSEVDRQADTQQFWTGKSDRLERTKKYTEEVERSAVTLLALQHGPTGAMVAAATTSLPEYLGGVRNWDMRHSRLRDGALSCLALLELGSTLEARRFIDWLKRVFDVRPETDRLSPIYLVTGRHLPPEAEITGLPGYGGSRPVRVGNAADMQVQLDLYGQLLQVIDSMKDQRVKLSVSDWRLVENLVVSVARRWQEPDHGMWESRTRPQHYVHSKVYCWLAVDRGIRISRQFCDRVPTTWAALRDDIAADVLEKGWNEQRQSFTATYGGTELDVGALSVGLSGLLSPDDPRFASTVEAVRRELLTDGTVYNSHSDDGLPGRRHGVHLATSMLIDSLMLVDRNHEALELLDRLARDIGPTGLLSAQIDPKDRRALGNLPAAASHAGFIMNAVHLSR